VTVEGLLHKALATSRVGSHDAALAAVRHALVLAPESTEIPGVLAVVLLRKGDFDDAEAALLSSGPLSDADDLLLHATILFRRGRAQDAVERARDAVALAPESPSAHYQLGGLLEASQTWEARWRARREGRRDHECERHWEQAIRLAPEHLPARARLGMRALEFNELRRAQGFAKECLAIDPAFASGRLLAGQIAWQTGHWRAAREHADWLLANGCVDHAALTLLHSTKLRAGPIIRPIQRVLALLNGRPIATIASLFCLVLALSPLLSSLLRWLPDRPPVQMNLLIGALTLAVTLPIMCYLSLPGWLARHALKAPKLSNDF